MKVTDGIVVAGPNPHERIAVWRDADGFWVQRDIPRIGRMQAMRGANWCNVWGR